MSEVNPSLQAGLFETLDDHNVLQSVTLAAAINGSEGVGAWVQQHHSSFDEPYKTVAGVWRRMGADGAYVDRHTLALSLRDVPLKHRVDGEDRELTPNEAVALLFAGEVEEDRARAYMQAFESSLGQRRRREWEQRVRTAAETYAGRPEELIREVRRLEQAASQVSAASAGSVELLELIPFMRELTARQTGRLFQGLDSGFQHLNHICNGLDTGLLILAAPPGRGKTTLAWQMACQVATVEQTPVIFVSMEQSKEELRAKALARLSRLDYRHILRGRLQANDAEQLGKLYEAALHYADAARWLTIVEGDDTTTVQRIQNVARSRLAAAGVSRCLVVVDYLQVVPLREQDVGRATSPKDRIDLNLTALRRLARDLHSPVLAISSENRAGYAKKNNLDVFKESGGIEYGADVAMILAREKAPPGGDPTDYAPLDLNIVKNRNGERGTVKLRFYARRAEFVETERCALLDDEEG